ncbi:hypothetical protein AQUCO_00100437v1 [Aquilegia coerulea]|uniref:Uncharacterized protein n=1 Tax=Aquilegia coerulea TaxID=218851 RepID=A0A2G5FAE1_AQUCA|nr:hypothetical protein AQUCO_00100437v1 [Aquilegia coerulea]
MKHREIEARIAQLNNEISEFESASEKEKPFVFELQTKVKELRHGIQGLNYHQMTLHTSCQALRNNNKEINEKISTAELTLAQSSQENAKLRSKIVQSPKRGRWRSL